MLTSGTVLCHINRRFHGALKRGFTLFFTHDIATKIATTFLLHKTVPAYMYELKLGG